MKSKRAQTVFDSEQNHIDEQTVHISTGKTPATVFEQSSQEFWKELGELISACNYSGLSDILL
jgi:hypothetical protein